jgi:hypothetical protein
MADHLPKLLQIESTRKWGGTYGHRYVVRISAEHAEALQRIYQSRPDRPDIRIQDFMRDIVAWYAEKFDPGKPKEEAIDGDAQ